MDASPNPIGAPPEDAMLLVGANARIDGRIDDKALESLMQQLGQVRAAGEDLVFSLTTAGGDADTARRIALELRIFQDHSGKQAWFVGKTTIYSAGVTIMAAFPPARRFLTRDATLLLHERQIDKALVLKGPLAACQQMLGQEMQDLKEAERLEREDFRRFVEGSVMTIDDVLQREPKTRYITAQEALDLRLVARLIGRESPGLSSAA